MKLHNCLEMRFYMVWTPELEPQTWFTLPHCCVMR